MSADVPRKVAVSTFLRSFLIQGSWNYHTMIGNGFAFSLLPAIRRARASSSDDDAGDAALRRHVAHFNAHPYLASVALGAALRMEAAGAAPDQIQRFKAAVRGPLGSLGDALVWASWLPAVSILALILYWAGAGGAAVVLTFLVVYNIGHVGLRLWGFLGGLRAGTEVGRHLANAALGKATERVRAAGSLLLGVLSGIILAGEEGLGALDPFWAVLSVAAFVAGLTVGHRMWRPTAVAVVAAVSIVATWGLIR